MTRVHGTKRVSSTVSADEKGRLKYCKFVFCRCNMYYCDAYGSKIQFNLSSTYYSMRNRMCSTHKSRMKFDYILTETSRVNRYREFNDLRVYWHYIKENNPPLPWGFKLRQPSCGQCWKNLLMLLRSAELTHASENFDFTTKEFGADREIRS